MIKRGLFIGLIIGILICGTSSIIAKMEGNRDPYSTGNPNTVEYDENEYRDYNPAKVSPDTTYSSTANAQYYYTSIDYEQYGNLDDADIGDPADYEEYDYELPEG